MLRALAVFVAVFAIYAALSGPRLLRPSPDNHFVHMASAWLHGRLDLPGRPPHRNDWGKISTYVLDDGTQVVGIVCRTAACAAATGRGEIAVRTMDGDVVEISRRRIRRTTHRYYVTFPPGPAVVLLPLVALLGFATPDTLICVLAGALAPALLVLGLDRLWPPSSPTDPAHPILALALALGSPLSFVAPAGGVWFLAQAIAVACAIVAIVGVLGAYRPMIVGLALALLLATRPTVALGVYAFVAVLWARRRPRLRTALAVVVPSIVVGLALAAHNFARFGDVFEFGHRFLDVAWQPRIQEHGLFSLRYLPRNLHAMFLLAPKIEDHGLRVSIHGMSLLLASPWVAGVLRPGAPYASRAALAVGAITAAAFPLLYQNTGQVQFSPRFALDFLPFLLVHLAAAGTARRPWFAILVAVASVVGIIGGALFVRAPGRLFVPSLWPYGAGP